MHVLLAGEFTAPVHAQLREILFELGADEILDARDAAEAEAAVKLVNFDLMIVDLRMPAAAGGESLPEQRRRGQLHVPVVVIVNYMDPVQMVRARKLGVKRCQSRPITPEGIHAVIHAATRGPSLECAAGGLR